MRGEKAARGFIIVVKRVNLPSYGEIAITIVMTITASHYFAMPFLTHTTDVIAIHCVDVAKPLGRHSQAMVVR
jgi:hypothetical protein